MAQGRGWQPWAELKWGPGPGSGVGRPQGSLDSAREGCWCPQDPDTLTNIVTLIIPL